jgi:hypothetical protein
VGALTVLLALTACSAEVDTPKGGSGVGSTAVGRGSSAPAGSAPAKVSVPCADAKEVNQDDDGAANALLFPSQLPGGAWSVAPAVPCPWALAADDLLAAASCRDAATAAGAPPDGQKRNGNARVTYARGGVQVDDRIEIYLSSQNVDAIRAVLVSPSLASCITAAITARAAHEPGTSVRDITVAEAPLAVDAATLGLGFPAVEGYAADSGFVEAMDVSFTTTIGGTDATVALRLVAFGAGGLMSIVTVIGPTAATVAAVDLDAIVQAAAKQFRTMINGPTP